MALQHFYTRVPARVSMYNRTDGFDTFACSEGITQEFVQKELNAVCNQKLTAADGDAIRAGAMPPVYSRLLTRAGVAVQSCVSYLPLDYTGERISYMVHSLVLPTEEEDALLRAPDAGAMDITAFRTTPDGFDLTGATAMPDANYPALAYAPAASAAPDRLCEYDAGTVKRLLLALLLALCGKLKSVYVVTNEPDGDNDAWMRRLIDALYRILPHHLRRQFTYVTRVVNTTQYPGARLKGTPLSADEMQAAKSAVIDLRKKVVSGVREEEFKANRECIDHFYDMLIDSDLRCRFFDFCLYAADAQSSFGECSLKKLNECVFLFRAGCGLYEEKLILANDDRLLDMITLYESAREALPLDVRVRLMHALDRYPASHKEIPKKIFAKMTKVYPTEPEETQQVFLRVALELIHTDAMREKLFTFLRNAYEGQGSEGRLVIVQHLCGVFYGGFLQTQLLGFFGKIYRDSEPAAQEAMLEKALLAIRTKTLRTHLITFFEEIYPDMEDSARERLYLTIVEQLPEGDDLARALLAFVDHYLPRESVALRRDFSERLFGLLETEQRRSAHPLLPLLDSMDTYCGELVVKHVFNSWSNRKIFDEYVTILMKGGLSERMATLRRLCALVPSDDRARARHLSDAVCASFAQTNLQTDLGGLLEAEAAAKADAAPLVGCITTRALTPMIARSLTDVFRMPLDESGRPSITVEQLVAYSKGDDILYNSKACGVLRVYVHFKEAAACGRVDQMIELCGTLPQDARRREEIGAYALADEGFRALPGDAMVALTLLLSYLHTGAYHADACFTSCRTSGVPSKQAMDPDLALVGQIFDILCRIYRAVGASPEMQKALTAPGCGLRELMASLRSSYGKSAARFLEKLVSGLSGDDGHFALYCQSLLNEGKPTGGLFGRLFGRK